MLRMTGESLTLQRDFALERSEGVEAGFQVGARRGEQRRHTPRRMSQRSLRARPHLCSLQMEHRSEPSSPAETMAGCWSRPVVAMDTRTSSPFELRRPPYPTFHCFKLVESLAFHHFAAETRLFHGLKPVEVPYFIGIGLQLS